MQYELLNIIAKIKDNNIKLLDPFCGSGTTKNSVAQNLGIDSTGIDINLCDFVIICKNEYI